MSTTVVIFLTLGTRDQGLPGRELRSFDNLKLKLLLGLGVDVRIYEEKPSRGTVVGSRRHNFALLFLHCSVCM